MSSNIIHWFESAALDDPTLRSPQPCKRGIHCDYKLPDKDSGELVRACCSGVHPGEEGTGRRLFPARTTDDGKEQPACVRLTGASEGFYMRRRLRLSWAEWCERHEIPFTPALPGQPFEPLVRKPLGGRRLQENSESNEVHSEVHSEVPHQAPAKLTKNQRKRANKKAAREMPPRSAAISCEDLEAELASGAHSPRPTALEGMRLGEASRATGTCSAGCACFFGGTCIDASNDGCATPFLSDSPKLAICPALIAEEAYTTRPPRQILASCYCGTEDCTCFDARRAEYDANTSGVIFLRRLAEQIKNTTVGESSVNSESKDDSHSKDCFCITCCSDEELVARRKRAVRASGGSFYQWAISGSSQDYQHSKDCGCITCKPDEKPVAWRAGKRPMKIMTGRFDSLASPRIPFPQATQVTTTEPQPPTPLNLLPGYTSPAEVNEEDQENETPMLTPTLIPNQDLEGLD